MDLKLGRTSYTGVQPSFGRACAMTTTGRTWLGLRGAKFLILVIGCSYLRWPILAWFLPGSVVVPAIAFVGAIALGFIQGSPARGRPLSLTTYRSYRMIERAE